MSTEKVECSECGLLFNTEIGMKRHKGRGHKPYMYKSVLSELYFEQGLSTYEIADKLDTNSSTVASYLKRHNLKARNRSEAQGGYKFRKDELQHLYHTLDLSTVEIANVVDIDESCVYRQMKRRGVEMKDMCGENHPHWQGGDVETDCENCGSDMTVKRGRYNQHENLFCSKECHYHWRVGKYTDEDNWNYVERVEVECEYCGSIDEYYPHIARDRRFCSNECKESNMRENWKRDGHPRWKGGFIKHYGENWDSVREEVTKRDGGECRRCGMGQEEHMRKFDYSLHVHHINPKREFVQESGKLNYEAANATDNLITLCCMCHRDWEKLPIRPQLI
jgi:predicted DNA-binding protein YlxM (UPF0122 family)/endogenous inhibitor of DNA gyrase (YacG/DUF329 family)/uncharacterized C2H2 Zn-finger protein